MGKADSKDMQGIANVHPEIAQRLYKKAEKIMTLIISLIV